MVYEMLYHNDSQAHVQVAPAVDLVAVQMDEPCEDVHRPDKWIRTLILARCNPLAMHEKVRRVQGAVQNRLLFLLDRAHAGARLELLGDELLLAALGVSAELVENGPVRRPKTHAQDH